MTLPNSSLYAILVRIQTRLIMVSCAGIAVTASAYLLGGWLVTILVIAGVILAIVGRRYLRRLNDRIDYLQQRLERQTNQAYTSEPTRVEHTLADADELHAPAAALIDLAALGSHDPSSLVAATLDRSAFPRLATSMADSSPTDERSRASSVANSSKPWSPEPAVSTPLETAAHGLTTLNLMRQWKHGLRSGDLAACRRTYAALADASDAEAGAVLKRQLDELADRVEHTLRAEFVEAAQQRDYATLLAVGQRIVDLMPDRLIADEFLRLKPHLDGRSLAVRQA